MFSGDDLPEGWYYEIPDWTHHFQWLAVVGAREFKNANALTIAGTIITNAIGRLEVDDREFGIVSGGAVGIDTLGEQIADDGWFRKCILPPKNKRWEPDGFKARNELIGEVCDWMIGVRCEYTKSWGTGHACEYAESLGKPVERYVIHDLPGCVGCEVDASWKGGCRG